MANQEEQFWVFQILCLHDTCLHSYYILKDPCHSLLIDSTSLHYPNNSEQMRCFPVNSYWRIRIPPGYKIHWYNSEFYFFPSELLSNNNGLLRWFSYSGASFRNRSHLDVQWAEIREFWRNDLCNSFWLPANGIIFCHEHVHLWRCKAIKILGNIFIVFHHCKREHS